MNGLFEELKRRNVFKVTLVYVVASWLLMQIVDVMFPALRLPEWTITFVAALLIIGFPVAIIFAWAFEITPEGLKREKDVDRSKSITRETGQKLNYLVIGVLVVAVGYLVTDKFLLRPNADSGAASMAKAGPSEYSIAVMPFADMSAEGDQEYFSDGISEELLNLLAKVKDFRVAGRTSSFAFKGEDQDLREVGAKLNVGHVLEGSVRKAGDQVRITAQLINVDDGYHLWSESYDRQLDNIFQVQDEIAQAVVAALKQTLLGDEASPPRMAATPSVDTEAYDLYLRAKFHMHKRTPESLQRALDYYHESLTLDADYAPAWAGVAVTWLLSDQYSNVDHDEALEQAEQAINRAFEITDADADTWAALGLLEHDHQRYERAEAALLNAIAINANHAMAHMWLGNVFGFAGQPGKAAEYLEHAFEIDPLHPTVMLNRANSLKNNGRIDEARKVLALYLESYPERGRGQAEMGELAYQAGDFVEAQRWFLQAYQRAPERIFAFLDIPWLYLDVGEIDLADEWLVLAEQVAPNEWGVVISRWESYRRQQAFEQLVAYSIEQAERFPNAWWMKTLLGVAYHLNGDLDAALEAYRAGLHEQTPEGDAALVTGDVNRAYFYDWYAAALMETGDAEKAREVARAGLEALQETWDQGHRRSWQGEYRMFMAALHAVLGENQRALELLRGTVAEGVRESWLWTRRPSMAGLQDDLGFINLVEEVEADIARQHAQLQNDGLLLTPEQALTADL